MRQEHKKFSTLEGFIQSIPRVNPLAEKPLQENLDFRIDLHTLCAKDKSLQDLYLAMCLEAPQIAFDSMFWTYNPQKPVGERNQPFILRPAQIPAVNLLHDGMIKGYDIGIDKSRKMGASAMCAKLGFLHVLLIPETHGILGSRKEDLVDKKGDPTTLFAKIDHTIKYLPGWLRTQLHIERNHMILNILDTESSIVGETTNESFSAGSRSTWMVLDEFGRVKKRFADAIEGSIHDVTNCVIYSSTHWYGSGHTFNQALVSPTTKVIRLMWYEAPDESKGLYTSPQPGYVQLIDEEYYRKNHPGLFEYV